MNWLIGGALAVVAVAVVGPPLLRAAAKNPQLLTDSASTIEAGRAKAIEYGKRGASAAYEAGRSVYEKRRASQLKGTFGGLLR